MFLWTGRMQFWQSSGNFLGKRPNFIAHSPKMMEIYFFWKRALNYPDGHGGCSFQNSAIKFLSKGRQLLAHCPKRMKKTIFWIKNLSPMFSLGHLECSFDNFVERFLRKSRNFFSQCPRLIKKGRKNQKNPSKLSKGHVEGDLDNPTLKNVNKRQKLSRSICEIEMKKILSQKQYFSGKCS